MRKRSGFTLLELVVTIVVVGILAATAIHVFTAVIERARLSSAKASAVDIFIEARGLAAFDQVPLVDSYVIAAEGDTKDLVIDPAGPIMPYFYAVNTSKTKFVLHQGGSSYTVVFGDGTVTAQDGAVLLDTDNSTGTASGPWL